MNVPPGLRPANPARRRLTLSLLGGAGTLLLPLRAPWAQQAGTGTKAEATPPLYLVEIVLFRGSGAAPGEDVSAVASEPIQQDSDSASADAARAPLFGELLPSSRYKLGDVVTRLNRSSARRVIAHAAWTQTAAAWNSGNGPDAQQLGLAAAGVTGMVRLERGQYLHLGFNLAWSAPGGARYSLAQMRRVKPGDRQYYDHPAFAAIAQVTLAGNESG